MVSRILFGWYTDFEKPLLFSGQGLLALFSEGGMVRGRGLRTLHYQFSPPQFLLVSGSSFLRNTW